MARNSQMITSTVESHGNGPQNEQKNFELLAGGRNFRTENFGAR